MPMMGWKCELCGAVVPQDKPQGCGTCGYRLSECPSCSAAYPTFLGRCPSCAAICPDPIPPGDLPRLRQAFPTVFGLAPVGEQPHELEISGSGSQPIPTTGPSSRTTAPPDEDEDERYATFVDLKPAPAEAPRSEEVPTDQIALAIEENGDCPVAVQLESPRPLNESLQGQLHLRLKPYVPDSPFRFEINAKGTALTGSWHEQGMLEQDERKVLRPIGFEAESPGLYLIRMMILLSEPSGEPLGRWVSNVSIYVEEDRDEALCRVEGDVLSASNHGTGEIEAASRSSDWRTVRLKRDRHFEQTVRRSAQDKFPPPPDFFGRGASVSHIVGHGLLIIKGRDTDQRLAVHVGEKAVLGRGNASEGNNHFPLNPEPYDADAFGRMSRAHVEIELWNNRAWVTAIGRNFTAINGSRVPNGKRQQVKDGDDLSIAGVIDFKVRLWVLASHVAAIRLVRKDPLRSRLGYLLVLGESPFPWTSDNDLLQAHADPGFWGAFAANSAGELVPLRYSEQKGDWLPVRANPSPIGQGLSLSWHSLGQMATREQETYLA